MGDSSENHYQEFTEILSDKAVEELAQRYGVEDQRERKLPLRVFFWLMVLSATLPTSRGGLSQLVGFFVSGLTLVYPGSSVVTLTRMAISLKLKGVHWYFFRGVYNLLLERYERILLPSERSLLSHFRKAFVLDGSVVRVAKALEKVFQGVHKGKAALKLHTRLCLKNLTVDKLQVTKGKRHDSRFRGVTQQAGILYLFDLGYWKFALFERIIQAKSFFVSRLKKSCDPLIHAVSDSKWTSLIGKRLSEILPLLSGETTFDAKVTLSTAKNPRFNRQVRLVGLLHEEDWYFYITNLFDATLFTAQVIYDLYRQRWSIEIFFNEIKHLLHLEHLISKTKNGIMVEIYSALICHLLTRIVIALAAQKTGHPIEAFSFKRSFDLVKSFLVTHLFLLIDRLSNGLATFFDQMVEAVALLGLRDPPADDP